MKKQWQLLEPDMQVVENLCKTLDCHPATAAVLVNRNILSADQAGDFLNASLDRLRPPFAIKDMDIAVRRIAAAIKGREKILIFGDYDVDGITATTILWEFLRDTGADVSYYIPHKLKEGYGLQTHHINNSIGPKGINLIITVDCGSSSHAAVEAARAAGIDVVITDHHIPPATLPRAVAVVNPKRPECHAGFEDLAGVGVAFNLLIGLRKQLRDMHFWQSRPEPNLKKIIDLVAIGTLADMVPLVNENRILSKNGLDMIGSSDRPGITALLMSGGLQQNALDADDMRFNLVPMLNAAGRIDHASIAVELLTTDNAANARKISRLISDLNERRRRTEKIVFDAVMSHLSDHPHLLQKKTLVLSGHGWHEGVLGIVAARMVQKYFRPVILFNISDGIGKGSARSIPGFNIVEGLQICAEDLESFGGHSMAAGLKIHSDKINDFQKKLERTVDKMTKPADFIPTLPIDWPLDFNAISGTLIDELERLKPFGADNREPIFMTGNLKVISSENVGKGHRRMRLKQVSDSGSKTFGAIHFNAAKHTQHQKMLDKIAFRLRWNRWSGKKIPQIVIEDFIS